MTETTNLKHVNQPFYSSIINAESLCQSLMKSNCNLHSKQKSNISSSEIQILGSSASKVLQKHLEGRLAAKEGTSKRWSDQISKPSVNKEFLSDEYFRYRKVTRSSQIFVEKCFKSDNQFYFQNQYLTHVFFQKQCYWCFNRLNLANYL